MSAHKEREAFFPSIYLYKLNTYGWLVFFVVFNLYCIFWRQYAAQIEYNFVDSLIWFIKEWAVWLILSYLMLCSFEQGYSRAAIMLIAGVACQAVAVTARAQWNSGEYPPSWLAVATIMLPKYITLPMPLFAASGFI